ncbi:MAG: helix-turn-helix transcriptional regulator [Desulfobacteraceae bacterium]|nr:helix-turn-helix transcriptional regulator [Desulfobacteraceae bacterium]
MSKLTVLLNNRMSTLDIDQEELGKKVGLSQPAIHKILSGKTKKPRSLAQIANVLNIPLDVIFESIGVNVTIGTGLPQAKPAISNSEGITSTATSEDVGIPQYKDVSLAAGHGSNIYQEEVNGIMYFKKNWLKSRSLSSDYCVVVYAVGDSMSPVINDGSVILVNTKDKKIIDGKYYALNYSGEARVKALYKKIDGSILIRSISTEPAYKDEILTPDELEHLHIVGRVVWVGNEL